MLVDRRGIPLSSVITGANKHDMKSAFPTIDSIVVDRPKVKQNICMNRIRFSRDRVWSMKYGVRKGICGSHSS